MPNTDIEDYQLHQIRESGNSKLKEVHNSVSREKIEKFKEILKTSATEKPLQEYLNNHPEMVPTDPIGAGTCGWVVAQPRLGAEYVPDFLSVRLNSSGLTWTMIELQNPEAPLFTTRKRKSEQLEEGVRQIDEWRDWLSSNEAYTQRSRYHGGLGLPNLNRHASGLVVIGKRENKTMDDLKQMRIQTFPNDTYIRSYEGLIERAERTQRTAPAPGEECDYCGLRVGILERVN